jgi:hypothetical protein
MATYEPPDEAAFAAWRDANPNGYIINTERSGCGYILLHRATCTHMRSQPPFINATYTKICSDSPSELDLWALQRCGVAARRCKARGTNCWLG